MHAGGKFEEAGYKVSGGLHGVGASVVNALSKWMEVIIHRDKGEYFIRFHKGGIVDTPLTKIGNTNRTGTKVHFMPDDKIFGNNTFSFTTISERMQESAFLLKGLTVTVTDEETGRTNNFCYKDGIK